MEKESEDSKEVSRGRRERANANEEKKDESEIASSKGGRRRRESDTKEETGGGWFTSGSESGARKATVSKHFDDEVENSDGNKNSKHFQDNDEIVIIPDLEEDGGDADGRVAQAPRNVHRKIPTLNDLEDEVKAAIPSIEGGFDLKVLLSTLVPPGQVQEQDVTWSFDSLLRDVTDELTAPQKTVISTTIGSPSNTPKKEKKK